MQSLIADPARARAADMLDRVDLTPAAVRADLAGPRVASCRVFAAAEVVSRAADLCCESAALVHDNERRWRVTRERTEQLLHAMAAGAGQAPTTGEAALLGETGPSD